MEKRKKFIEKAIKKHGDKYDYSQVVYENSQAKVCIICPEHGEFWQAPAAHVRGNGCPVCSKLNKNKELRKTTDEFIYESIKVHGIKYNYSKTNYINAKTKVCITCEEHGDFWMLPFGHLNGQGCPKCVGKHMDTDLFIEKAKLTHRDKYDYSKVVYENSQAKVCIICPEHGEFWQAPAKHLYGRGCPKCGKEISKDKLRITLREFKERANKVHESKYDYSKVELINGVRDKITIICPKHGEFQQIAYDHLNEHGCPSCAVIESKGEREIYDFICGIIGDNNVERKNRNILEGKEIDIFIPSLSIGIEYNGLRWHSEEFGKDKNYHLNKTEECKNRGIKLYQIFEDEYLEHREIVLNKIKHILLQSNKLTKIYGRNCEILEISKDDAKVFLERNHIQGYGKSTLFLGGFFNDKLIAVMGFKRENKEHYWELTRFASDYDYVCCGVGSKIFKHFINEYNPQKVKSFADRRWTLSEENLYTKMGFKLDGVLKPEYRYINLKNSNRRIHKFNFRKNTVNLKYGLPLTMTESEMAKEIGYSKIWDCGLYRYVWEK